ncbi:hypothetical protein DACRYDRAFT_111484 [Dacryopinax primogenitus]|uniref:Dol-P-Glc:Glc(2)Man(9)GlcNAc(2)-PP-Dol alpha-1,2-glucosyltransferase n=1 Tax=Dacryopinax primogenitus (strain DJM 731) TaxID=1858805 RepID=M5G2H4_DACPD|nr:uncharacterized protein DACRYDRAFT_111484 [Dacryopinax primogenitus]EJT97967.1 hypothetical protein DACRYDRAFT_111484 [Dacryopinax primogenitus]
MSQKSPLPYIAFCVLNIYVLRSVNEVLLKPYMDEPFHVPQAQRYCSFEFDTYDPKLTTPPGLYLFSLGISKLFAMRCSLPLLRFHSTLLLLSLPPILSHLLPLLQPPPCSEPPRTFLETLRPGWEAIVLGFMPVAWFTGFLYYTDLGAVVFALGAIVAAKRGQSGLAALLGTVGCLFRQTNIVWLGYAASLQALEILHRPSPSKPHLADPTLSLTSPTLLLRTLLSLPSLCLSRLPELLSHLWPYVLPLTSFCAFVLWNGGIALGDRAHHEPTPHWVLPMYFLVFSTALAAPALAGGPLGVLGLGRVVASKIFSTPRRIGFTLAWTAVLCILINRYTIAHPFLLSDNRHYPFYLWRRLISPFPLARYLWAPVYLLCFRIWTIRLGEQPLLPLLSLAICTLATLVPTPLLEPRYFIIPFLLLRCYLETSALGVAGEGLGIETPLGMPAP